MSTIGQAYSGRDNRFTLIRLVLSSMVMLEHMFVVFHGPDAVPDILNRSTTIIAPQTHAVGRVLIKISSLIRIRIFHTAHYAPFVGKFLTSPTSA